MYADSTSICHLSFGIAHMNAAINRDFAQVEKLLKGKHSLNLMETRPGLISTKPKQRSLKHQDESLNLKIRNDELDIAQKTKYQITKYIALTGMHQESFL